MEIEFRLTPRQTQAFDYLTDNEDRKVLFGGAKGGGKSFLFCLWAYQWTKYLIDFFELKPSPHPLPVGFIGRKQGVDFNDTTFETFKKIIPSDCYTIRQQEKEIVIENSAKILYGGLDDTEVVKKFNSSEFAFIGIDQAEETTRPDVSVLQATLRLTHNGKCPPYKELYTANPSECWLKDDFILGSKDNYVFVPALPDDNPYLPFSYKKTLEEAFGYDPALLKAYLKGDWDAWSGREGYLISSINVNACRKNVIEEEEDELRIVSGDVATKHGDNNTVILKRIGHTIHSIQILPKVPTTETKRYLKQAYESLNGDTLVVDSDGVGEGVSDMLIMEHMNPLEFHGGSSYKAMDALRFKNLRSQFYWVIAKKIEKGLYSFAKLPQREFEILRKQLCSIKVKAPDGMGRIQIESKEDMLARSVESPDLADALMMSEYGYFMGRMSDIGAYQYR